MSCKFCSDTNMLTDSELKLKNGQIVFGRLRLDMDNEGQPCLDIQIGIRDDNYNGDSDWSDPYLINYCPTCGRKLI